MQARPNRLRWSFFFLANPAPSQAPTLASLRCIQDTPAPSKSAGFLQEEKFRNPPAFQGMRLNPHQSIDGGKKLAFVCSDLHNPNPHDFPHAPNPCSAVGV